jgi:hypothetical protein
MSGSVLAGVPHTSLEQKRQLEWGSSEVHGAAGVMVASLDQSGLPA